MWRVGAVGSIVALFVGGVVAQGGPPAAAQGAAAGADAAVTLGATLFRARCAECHGADAKGVAGHDLTRLWASGATDDRVFQTVRDGVPNTIMPSSSAPDSELRAMVAYLRSLSGPAGSEPVRGNVENGARVFGANCAECHAINGRGGRLGPDLSRIAQSRAQLTQAIRTPGAATAAGYQPVTLALRNGQRVKGTIKGEDAFSIQIMDTNQRLRAFLKSTLDSVVRDTGSLMPEFGPNRLSDGDLDDLLAYLGTLRPAGTPARPRGGQQP
jgi:cytochrome c oxidase cbb3-type subunit 3